MLYRHKQTDINHPGVAGGLNCNQARQESETITALQQPHLFWDSWLGGWVVAWSVR